MPITRLMAKGENDGDISIDVFRIQDAIEVYDGPLALAIDHLMNHVKVLVSLAYLPGGKDLKKAMKRHPALRRLKIGEPFISSEIDGRSPDRIMLNECQQLLEGIVEIAHLAAWPETSAQSQTELEKLQKRVPFLDYRYENDPYISDSDRE